jgi:hypothetical protein
MRRGCLGAAARRLPRQQSLEPLFVPLVRLPPLLAGLLTTEGLPETLLGRSFPDERLPGPRPRLEIGPTSFGVVLDFSGHHLADDLTAVVIKTEGVA